MMEHKMFVDVGFYHIGIDGKVKSDITDDIWQEAKDAFLGAIMKGTEKHKVKIAYVDIEDKS